MGCGGSSLAPTSTSREDSPTSPRPHEVGADGCPQHDVDDALSIEDERTVPKPAPSAGASAASPRGTKRRKSFRSVVGDKVDGLHSINDAPTQQIEQPPVLSRNVDRPSSPPPSVKQPSSTFSISDDDDDDDPSDGIARKRDDMHSPHLPPMLWHHNSSPFHSLPPPHAVSCCSISLSHEDNNITTSSSMPREDVESHTTGVCPLPKPTPLDDWAMPEGSGQQSPLPPVPLAMTGSTLVSPCRSRGNSLTPTSRREPSIVGIVVSPLLEDQQVLSRRHSESLATPKRATSNTTRSHYQIAVCPTATSGSATNDCSNRTGIGADGTI